MRGPTDRVAASTFLFLPLRRNVCMGCYGVTAVRRFFREHFAPKPRVGKRRALLPYCAWASKKIVGPLLRRNIPYKRCAVTGFDDGGTALQVGTLRSLSVVDQYQLLPQDIAAFATLEKGRNDNDAKNTWRGRGATDWRPATAVDFYDYGRL